MELQLVIPANIRFSELALKRERHTNRLLYASGPLLALCRLNGFDPKTTLADEDLACWLICGWYRVHRAAAGKPDPVAEQILAEIAEAQEVENAGLPDGAAWAY